MTQENPPGDMFETNRHTPSQPVLTRRFQVMNMSASKQKILVVDDEESLCEIIQFNLEVEGYDVDTANSAEEALRLDLTSYDLILLDVMMGEISGYRFARMLRERPETARIPIIFCTARDSEDDIVTGLNIGADDYIAKPFSTREVIARVRSVLRRTEHQEEKRDDGTLAFETLQINRRRKCCTIDGEEVELTKKEFEILDLFLSHQGTILSRADILNQVWSNDVVVLDRTIDVNITRLRKKIGRYGNHIITRLGYGYGFE